MTPELMGHSFVVDEATCAFERCCFRSWGLAFSPLLATWSPVKFPDAHSIVVLQLGEVRRGSGVFWRWIHFAFCRWEGPRLVEKSSET